MRSRSFRFRVHRIRCKIAGRSGKIRSVSERESSCKMQILFVPQIMGVGGWHKKNSHPYLSFVYPYTTKNPCTMEKPLHPFKNPYTKDNIRTSDGQKPIHQWETSVHSIVNLQSARPHFLKPCQNTWKHSRGCDSNARLRRCIHVVYGCSVPAVA